MSGDIIYVKAEQNMIISNKKVFLEDVVKLYGENKSLVKDLSKLIFMTLKEGDKDIAVSILKVMETMHAYAHGIEIVNIGETDFIIEYRVPEHKKKSFEYLKTGVVTLIAFFGAAFSIMTFNTDVSVGQLFQKIYQLVLGTNGEGSHIIELSYSIGLSMGILIFYNHFTKKHLRDDPTPIQIEMRTFETDKTKAKIKTASREGKTMDAN
ncbi:MAG: stage V sporulation protein AA [Velocimicrobium sp.]